MSNKNGLFRYLELTKSVIEDPYYVIGIDEDPVSVDIRLFSYVLIRKIGVTLEVILSKTMTNENEFKQEVENLARYFNAEMYQEE